MIAVGNSASSWLIIVLAVLAANLPFLNERLFAVINYKRFFAGRHATEMEAGLPGLHVLDPLDPKLARAGVTGMSTLITPVNADGDNGNDSQAKSMWLRWLELIILYFCVGGVAFALESAAGNRFPQGWEFYAITACLFQVLAFPGFVYRYLRRQHG